MIVTPKVVAAVLFDGTEKSIEDFIPKELYSINKATSQLILIKDNSEESIIQPGWTILKDTFGAFFGVEPAVYKTNFESQLEGK